MHLKKTLYLLFFLSLLLSCERNTEAIGPEYKIPSADFKMLNAFSAAQNNIDFSISSEQIFTASFSENVSWFVNLKGSKSGAKKSISGFSKELNMANCKWNGNHDDLYFFRSGETVVATLTFLGSTLSFTDTFNLVTARSWNIPGKIIPVLNFESGASTFDYQFYDGPSDKYPTYKVTYSVKNGVQSDMFSGLNNSIQSVLKNVSGDTIQGFPRGSIEGEKLYRFAGKDGVYNGDGYSDYFIGGAGMGKVGYYALSSDPDQVYFNIYVFGTGDPNSKLVINFNEDDDGNGNADAGNQSENYILYEDEYAYGIQVSWEGWKLISVKYDDLELSADGAKAKYGNKKKEPHKIAKMGFVLLSTKKGDQANVNFDFPVFTIAQIFNPAQ